MYAMLLYICMLTVLFVFHILSFPSVMLALYVTVVNLHCLKKQATLFFE